jgi:hemoglobin
MKEDVITEATIKRLVDDFYLKMRRDPQLGPVFSAAIGDSDAAWGPHLEKMYAFWSSVMLTSGRYHGNPLQKHKDLPAFDMRLFDRWLELFAQTAQELHAPEIAALYIAKSRRIAESLKLGLYYKPGDFPIAQAGA